MSDIHVKSCSESAVDCVHIHSRDEAVRLCGDGSATAMAMRGAERAMSVQTVAALYVQPGGVYYGIEGVEPWGLPERDAREYAGPWPVVAHPPCGAYSRLRHLHSRDDADCALVAVQQVRWFGGVLEQPAYSQLWKVAQLPPPNGLPDEHGGYSLELCQVEWGHVARKRTWLYCVGVPRTRLEPPFPGRQPTHWCSGFRSSTSRTPSRYKSNGCAVPPGIKVCSSHQRAATPPAFRDLLIAMARSARKDAS